MRCLNCNTEIADHLTVCWFCNSNQITLENFLNKKSKILVIIGVFGALSLYLLQIATTNQNNFLLQLGSGMSLLVMVVLSSNLILGCYDYIKKYPKTPGDLGSVGYTQWIKHSIDLLYLFAFLCGLCVIVSTVLLFMLFYSQINVLVLTVTFGFIFLFLFLAFIIMPSDAIVRKTNFFYQLMIIFLFSLINFILVLSLIRDTIKFSKFSFLMDIVIICLTFIGWLNAVNVTFQRADENWDYFSPFFQVSRYRP